MRTIAQLSDLSGRIAIVTGGAGHIGRAAAEALLELGAQVVLADAKAEACHDAVAALAASGRAHPFAVDLIEENATREFVRRVGRQFGRLDVVVHSAGYVGTTQLPGWGEPFGRQSVAAWDAAMRVNLTAAFVIAQEAQTLLTQSTRGSIVLVSSIYGHVGPDPKLYDETGLQNPTAYGVSKAGLIQLARYLATLLAPAIRVNSLSPGGVARRQPDVFVQRYVDRTPLARMASEEDLKGAIAYLASDLSAYVTGHDLVVDGGWTAW